MLKGKTPLIIAIILGVVAGAVAYTAIKRKEKEVRAGWNLVPVLVANQDISEGSTITFEMISQRPVPEQFVTSSVIKPDSANYVVGQKVLVPLQVGDLLTWTQFETSKASERLSTAVNKLARAVTVDVNGSKMSVGGWVRPNDHVDIVGSFRSPTSGEQVAVTLMQNVTVLATGKITGTTNLNLLADSDRQYKTITFLALPEEVEMISLAAELGNLTLALRNPEDVSISSDNREHTTITTLLTGVRAREAEAKRRDLLTVIRGSSIGREVVPGR